MNNELKPCPFCGGEAVIMHVEPRIHIFAIFMPDCRGSHFIKCTGCTCVLTSGNDREEAIAAWNKRSGK